MTSRKDVEFSLRLHAWDTVTQGSWADDFDSRRQKGKSLPTGYETRGAITNYDY